MCSRFWLGLTNLFVCATCAQIAQVNFDSLTVVSVSCCCQWVLISSAKYTTAFRETLVHNALCSGIFKSNIEQTARSPGVDGRWKNTTLSHCCKKQWNVAGIWLQWWSVALVTGRGFRWRLMQSWWQKAKGSQCMESSQASSLWWLSVCEYWPI